MLLSLFILLFIWILISYFVVSYQNKKRLQIKKLELIKSFLICCEELPHSKLKNCTISEIHKVVLEKITQ